jgi:hypothetical protein
MGARRDRDSDTSARKALAQGGEEDSKGVVWVVLLAVVLEALRAGATGAWRAVTTHAPGVGTQELVVVNGLDEWNPTPPKVVDHVERDREEVVCVHDLGPEAPDELRQRAEQGRILHETGRIVGWTLDHAELVGVHLALR